MFNEDPHKEINDKKHDDPSNWKFGMFYYNKNDKRIFPPKRLQSMGWTINFANPYSLIIMIVFIALLIIISKYFQ
jgi:uncharacterized membrane protein